jgi:putative acyl-CoA dehydrogenase
MRMALAQAVHHARHRSVFQRRLADQPMMRSVLADLALEVEAAVALVMRLARAFDHPEDAAEAARARLLTPAVKYWVCKTAPAFIYEAMECLGGNGYVEESILPRLYREAPVNAIWEGSGNVMCLDVMRVLSHSASKTRVNALVDGAAAHAVLDALAGDAGDLPGAHEVADLVNATLSTGEREAHARAAVGHLALLAAAAALRWSAPEEIAELFARTRLRDRHDGMLGTGDISADEARVLLERALPLK